MSALFIQHDSSHFKARKNMTEFLKFNLPIWRKVLDTQFQPYTQQKSTKSIHPHVKIGVTEDFDEFMIVKSRYTMSVKVSKSHLRFSPIMDG